LILDSLDELETELKAHKISRIYLILGPEQYLCRQALRMIRQKLISPETAAFNYSELNAESDSIENILAAVNTFPMMAPLRIVLLTNLAKLEKEQQERLCKYFANPCSKSVLILSDNELDRRTGLFRVLKEHACILEFPKLKGYELERWAAEHIRKRGLKISSVSIKKLVDLAGSDLQVLVNEIEKLLLFSGKGQSIADSDIDSLVGNSRQHGIFELISALGKNDRIGALKHLNSLLDAGERPLMIVSMMARHLRQVLIAKDILNQGGDMRDVASAAQVPNFLLNDFIGQARRMSAEAAGKMYLRLAESDLRFKSSSISERVLLETLICSW
jgi:DNA polymerase-3 subunit delta